MDKLNELYELIKRDETVVLATGTSDSVTMRTISPVFYENKILFFTNKNSLKFSQLQTNPNCCILIGNFFVEAKATFYGSTMLDENEKLRKVYDEKFPGAFDENVDLGGRDSDFVIFDLIKASGWEQNENGLLPFSIEIK